MDMLDIRMPQPTDLAAVRRQLGALHSDLRNRGKNPLEALRLLADFLLGEADRSLGLPSGQVIRELEASNFASLGFQEFIANDARSVFGQYLTPHVVASHVAALVDSLDGATVMDPFMGSGILLDAIAQTRPSVKLVGFEINEDVAHVGRAGLKLAGHSVDVTVTDAFRAWQEGEMPSVEVVVANPPFGAHASVVDRVDLSHTLTAKTLRNPAKLPVELLALELCMDVLAEGGQLAIVLPQSVLTNNRWAPYRAAFFTTYKLRHITSLPEATFGPFKGVAKACVLLVEKSRPTVDSVASWGESRSVGYDETGRTSGASDLANVLGGHRSGDLPVAHIDGEGHLIRGQGSMPSDRKSFRLGDIADISRGKNPTRDGYADEGPFLLKVGSLAGSFVSWRDRKRSRLPLDWYNANPRKHLRRGDICFTATAHRPSYIGLKVDLIDELPEDGAMASAEVIVLRLRDDAPFPPEALLYFLRGADGYASIQALVRGSTAHVYPRDLENIQVPDLTAMFDVEKVKRLHTEAGRAFRTYLELEDEAISLSGQNLVAQQ